MLNYPLQVSHASLPISILIRYLAVFPRHTLSAKGIDDITFTTEHVYRDGLHIKVVWIIDKPEIRSTSGVNVLNLLYDYEQQALLVKELTILSYSQFVLGQVIPVRVQQKFKFLLESNVPISHIEYCKMEYEVFQPSQLPDIFFSDLIQFSDNYIKFEEYLNKRDCKENGM